MREYEAHGFALPRDRCPGCGNLTRPSTFGPDRNDPDLKDWFYYYTCGECERKWKKPAVGPEVEDFLN